jgi:hypothetical protein
MKSLYIFSLGILMMAAAVQAYASDKNYSCDNGVQLQVQYQGAPGNEFADSASISGAGNLDGSYSALGDGVFFVRDGSLNGAGDRLDLGAIYSAQNTGTIDLRSWSSGESLTLKCQISH